MYMMEAFAQHYTLCSRAMQAHTILVYHGHKGLAAPPEKYGHKYGKL